MKKDKKMKVNEEKKVVVLDENGNPIETPEEPVKEEEKKIGIFDKAKDFAKSHEVVLGVACGVIIGIIGKLLLDRGDSEDDDDDCDMIYDDGGLSSFSDDDESESESDNSDDE